MTNLELRMSDNNNPVLRHLDKCNHRHLFRDASQVAKLQATVKSRMIECGYFLRATTEFDGIMCCSGIPTIDIPVLIYIPEVFYDVNQFRPNNWNPQVMPMYQVNIPTAEHLGISDGIANVNVNFNGNTQTNNQSSSAMMQTSFEPIKNNEDNMMISGGTQPLQMTLNFAANNGGMMSGGTEPNQMSGNMMMTSSIEPNNNFRI